MATQTKKTKVATAESSSSLAHLIVEQEQANKPIGVRIFGLCFRFKSEASKRAYHQALVLALTFLAYAAFHMGRRPLSVVKNVLNRDCSRLKKAGAQGDLGGALDETATTIFLSEILPETTTPINNNNVDYDESSTLEPIFNVYRGQQQQQHQQVEIYRNSENNTGQLVATMPKDTSCDWAPFDDDATANKLLAYLDSSFLLSYAIFMFFSGFIAERINLRYFISFGSLLSGLGLIAFGLAYSMDIHSMSYFVLVQIVSGAAQTTGWPVVVTCVSNWFDRAKLGTIYGLWNSHTNLGNILGATIAGYYVETDWGLSFIVPGVLMIIVGLILFLFLVPTPQDVELVAPSEPPAGKPAATSAERASARRVKRPTDGAARGGGDDAPSKSIDPMELASVKDGHRSGSSSEALGKQRQHNNKPISFMKALTIPGVIEYSLCLFFSKLVSYTFLYWLPRYITSSTSFSSSHSAYLSTPFDVGGIAGSILAGWLSDRYKVNGIICNIMLVLAIPSMFAYQQFGALSSWNNILLQLLVGSLVNGPYCLITTAVSADLGNRIKDGHAMATVSAIVDGMGSVGAVLGPLFAGLVSSNDWRSVFLMLMMADVLASLCIIRVTVQDVRCMLMGRGAAASTAMANPEGQA